MSNTDSKQEAPDRIWIQPQYFNRAMPDGIYHKEPGPRTVEYVRADLVPRASVAAPEEDAAHAADCCAKYMCGEPVPKGAHECGNIPWCRQCRVCVADAAASSPSPASPPPDALIQLLNAALLHPESAEGNIRQVIETLSSTNLELQTVRDENKRLCEHVADLNHDLEAAIKEYNERHG